MKILKILLFILLGLGTLWALLGLFAKKDYHIERSMVIDAPKELVYEHVRYFKNFESWSPWAHLDPNMKTSISGTDGAVGATYNWQGNDDVGAGKQIVKALTPDQINYELHFTEPYESMSPTSLRFEAIGDSTKVTWTFDMHIVFPWNGLAMFTDIDAGVGKDFAKGLENLKTVCEAMAHKTYRGYEIAELDLPETFYAGVRKIIPIADMAAFYAAQYPIILNQFSQKNINPAGAASGIYWTYEEPPGMTDMAAAFPIAENLFLGKSVTVFPIPASQALQIDYFGAYDSLGVAHGAIDDYMAEKNLQMVPPVIEEYITDPGQEPDTAKWLTRIIYRVQPKVDTLGVEQNPPKEN